MRQVNKYEIPDGTLFNSEKEAQEYLADKIQSKLHEGFKKIEFWDLKHRDLIKIFEFFVGDYDTIVKLQTYLNNTIGFAPYVPEEDTE